MKKKVLSVLLGCSLLFGTIFANAVSIEFEEMDMEFVSENWRNELDKKTLQDDEIQIEEMKMSPKAIESNENDGNELVTQSIEHDIISLANESNAWEFFYTGNVQEFIVPVSGYYKLECHGAGTSYSMGGYAEGTIYFEKNEKLYIYVGGQTNVFNGGNRATNVNMPCNNLAYGTASSGATDIRLIPASNNSWYLISHSSWNTDASLLSRIITAGGGASIGMNTSCSPSVDRVYYFYPYNYSSSNGNLGIGTAGISNQLSRESADKGGHRAIMRGSGGGGWYGGRTEGNVAYAGTSYVQKTYTKDNKTYTMIDSGIEEAKNNGNGKAKVILLSVPYTVNYYKMDLNGKYILDEIVVDTALIGTTVTPTVKDYIGFKSPQTITKIVSDDGSTEISYYYERNKYKVTYIDKDADGNEIGRIEKQIYYDTTVRGSDIGGSTTDNAYHNQYRYVSDTSAKVTTDGAVVYRVFEFCEAEAKANLQWNDNNNADGFRPDKYKLKLKQNGKIIDEVELSSDETNYTFPDLPKYDSNGNPYKYSFDVDASNRYQIDFDENGNLIIEDYQPANFSVIIPKKIVLDGRTGNADYTVSVNGTFYYHDTLTVMPEESLTLTDRSNISSMQAGVSQQKTSFIKGDGVANGTTVAGSVQVNRSRFAGSWQGSFNFDIKFKMQN